MIGVGTPRRTAALGLAVLAMVGLVGLVGLAGCGDDAEAAVSDGVLTVELSDFTFGNVPDAVPAGTRLEIVNTSAGELHELIAVRLPDGDDRPIDAVASRFEDLFESGPPAAVLLATPGGEQIDAVGDGTLADPGRYLLICSIPTGVNPAEFLAAAGEGEGPPDVGATGAPHAEHGMYTELEVTES